MNAAGVKGVERLKVMDMFVCEFGVLMDEIVRIEEEEEEEDENAGRGIEVKNVVGSKCSACWEREDDNLKMAFERESEVSIWNRRGKVVE